MLTPAVSAAPAAQTEDAVRQKLEKKRKMMDRIFSELNLSRAQVEAIEIQRKEYFDVKAKNLQKMSEKKGRLREALDAPEADREHIDDLISEVSELQTERMKNRVEVILGIKKVLTPEQYRGLQERKKAMLGQHTKSWKGEEEESF